MSQNIDQSISSSPDFLSEQHFTYAHEPKTHEIGLKNLGHLAMKMTSDEYGHQN